MSDLSYSAKLRDLSKDYYQNHINFESYRAQRKIIIDKIDEEFNGRKLTTNEIEDADQSSIFMKTIAFFKNSDINE